MSLPDLFDGAALSADWAGSAPMAGTSLPTVGGGVASGNPSSARLVASFDTGAVRMIEVIIPTQPADFDQVGVIYLDVPSNNGYGILWKEEPGTNNGQVVLYRIDAGVGAQIDNVFVNSGATYPLTLHVEYTVATTTFAVWINGVSLGVAWNYSTYTALNKPGFVILGAPAITQFDATPMPSGVILPRVDYSKHLKLALVGLS